MARHVLEDFEKQDKLNEGLFKTVRGEYFRFENCHKFITPDAYRFSPIKKQDKLNEELIRVKRGDYFPLHDIKEVWGEHERCFIATAVYGNANAPQVQTLREFRDNILIKNSLGRVITDFYYGGAGEKTAAFIKKHLPFSIPTIQRGLDALVKTYSKRK